MNFQAWLQTLKCTPEAVSQITSDSREVLPGSLFVAIPGTHQDGSAFLSEAEQKGARFLIGEKPYTPHPGTLYFQVSDARLALAQAASHFYQQPSREILMIGVTGTSGKTSTTYLIEAILKAAGYQVGVIGTIECRYGTQKFPSSLTTPSPEKLQALLFQMKKQGCNAVVMEVSSHALKQKRVAEIDYDVSVWTNLSPEHLDFHKDMEDYFQSKAILFRELRETAKKNGKKPIAVINQEDEWGVQLIQELKKGQQEVVPFYVEKKLRLSLDGISGTLQGISFQSILLGRLNASNIAAAIAVGKALCLPFEKIKEGIESIKGIPGRLEKVPHPKGVHIWVDYAHKPDALEKVLQVLHEARGKQRLLTVFGCGGDRDRQKRPQMGNIAAQYSNHVWITSDNPRTEEPMKIIQEILTGISSEQQRKERISIQPDRRQAVYEAVSSASPGDFVLIAGKGHEDYQILGHQKIHMDDRELALEAGLRKSSLTPDFKSL